VRVNGTEGLLAAVVLGTGICQLPDLLVDGELARGDLVEQLPSCRPEAMPINLVYPSGRLIPARVRVAIEALTALRRRAPHA
jgi:DNA-binding transcriptional LysR family regulator